MILHPAVIALLVSSGLMTVLTVIAAYFGLVILRRWDLASGSEAQLELERRTYLISTITAYGFGFQLLSLFLLIYTADSLCPLFTGAMCAAGTLNVNRFGYPLLVVKLLTFIMAGLWLIMNHADNLGYDYPLIRKKYRFLLALTPFLLADTVFQARYFLGLHPDVITSCCGSLFSGDRAGNLSELASVPPVIMRPVFGAVMSAALASTLLYSRTGKKPYLVSFFSVAACVVAVGAILSFIGPYVYELPTHHCPFCLLQKEYGFVGYALYLTLLAGTVFGLGVGLLAPFSGTPSLAAHIPVLQRRMALCSFLSFALFTGIVVYRIAASHLRM
jgi:hypothetical protein